MRRRLPTTLPPVRLHFSFLFLILLRISSAPCFLAMPTFLAVLVRLTIPFLLVFFAFLLIIVIPLLLSGSPVCPARLVLPIISILPTTI